MLINILHDCKVVGQGTRSDETGLCKTGSPGD